MDRLYLDFETRSELDVTVVGLDNYVRHPSTEVLMLGYAFNDDPVQLWEAHCEKLPYEVMVALEDPRVIKVAWSARFERQVFKHVMKIDIPIPQWLDPQVRAKMMSMQGHLIGVCKILQLPPEFTKDAAGKDLIEMFSMPTKMGGEVTLFGIEETFFRDWSTHPREWDQFCGYCKQDVVAERECLNKMSAFPLPESEQRGWVLDQEINERGLPVDMDLVRGASNISKWEKELLHAELKALTNLENTNSDPQVLAWVQQHGYTFNSLGKPFVNRALKGECDLTPECKRVLLLRKQSAKTSDSKLEKIAAIVSADGRLRHQYQYLGAAKTGRWASYDVQLANLPRPTKEVEENLELAVELLKDEDYPGLTLSFPNIMEVTTSCIRSMFRASPGHTLMVADLNAIENRMIGWIARCQAILKVFYEKKCPYLGFASLVHNIPYDELEAAYKKGDPKVKKMRQQAKPAVLGCLRGDTPVLTNRGWVPIATITTQDRIFDGESWVEHEGVIPKGQKTVINLFGVGVTPDHLIFGGLTWIPAEDVLRSTRYAKKVLSLARGLLWNLYSSPADSTTHAGASGVDTFTPCTHKTWNAAFRSLAYLAQIREFAKKKAQSIWLSMNRGLLSTDWRIGTTQLYLDAGGRAGRAVITEAEELNVGFQTSTRLSDMHFPWPVTKTQTFNSIESTTTDTTKRETFGLLLQKLITAIKQICGSSNGMGEDYLLSSSGNNVALSIGTQVQFAENSEKELLLKESLQNNSTVEVPTYDILNAGPKNRFMILTERGPLIVHNCGYRLSGGEEVENEDGDLIKTGLWGYAAQMGVDMSKDAAHNYVTIFRDRYPEIKQIWYDLENAVGDALRYGEPQEVGRCRVETFKDKLLRITLPSGRGLYYIRPKLELLPFGDGEKETMTFGGVNAKTKQWTRLKTHGGRLLENISQAISRDVLLNGMLNADEMGFSIIGHCHDELICEQPINSHLGLHQLVDAMTKQPKWALDLPLGAAGFVSDFYKKE